MPDNTWPNPKIVMCILNCIDRMNIDNSVREGSELERVVEIYKQNQPGAGYGPCQAISKNILDRWYRSQYNIKVDYDGENDNFDEGYKKLKR